MTVAVRRACRDDLDAVVAVEQAAFGVTAWSRHQVAEEFADAGGTGLIVVAEGSAMEPPTIVGYAVGRYVGDVADVSRVAVLSTHRRTGVGGHLLAAIVAEADVRGCARVLLEVQADNSSAVAMYAADGFRVIDRRSRYYPDDRDALVMARQLRARDLCQGGDGDE